MKRYALGFLALTFAACGGGEPAADEPMDAPATEAPAAEAPAAAGEMTMPDWYQMDGNNVTLDITAGLTDTGNYWNYNGYQNGNLTIAVPVGADVTINFQNNDPNMPHSIGVSQGFETAPATVAAEPVFEGVYKSQKQAKLIAAREALKGQFKVDVDAFERRVTARVFQARGHDTRKHPIQVPL